MSKETVTILCSGVALGVYIPAVLIDYQLKKHGIKTEVVVLENLLADDKKVKINENKKAFHKNFRLALTGQKLARDLYPTCSQEKINALFTQWNNDSRRYFIVFSGFWMSFLNEYFKKSKINYLNIDIIHMDADISASWKLFTEDSKIYNNIWLYSWQQKKLLYELPVTSNNPFLYNDRPDRFVIHGGGWGMGTYQSKIPELLENKLNLDIIAYDINEANDDNENTRYFMIDPDWTPWIKNENNNHEFPLFGEIKKNNKTIYKNKNEYHELFDVISKSKAIISKPGGATLLDSLQSATPIIMLDPFGDYEQKNADLWKYLGFGIYYDEWKKSGFSINILEELHKNLLKTRGTLINYPLDYINKNPGLFKLNKINKEYILTGEKQ